MNPSLPPSASPFDLAALSGWVPLHDWGVIHASGADAASFLHNQLTQDFLLLGPDQARLAAFCNAKGRMQASFVGYKRQTDELLLLCPRDLLPTTLKRLKMFVLRAKAVLSDASETSAIWGVVGRCVPDHLPVAPWSRSQDSAGDWVRLPQAEGLPRALLCSAPDWHPPTHQAQLADDLWHWLEVRSGVTLVTQPLYERFVPQMLNYESVGGVNFKKGCYPGQEVVARSQFRGTLKRRAYLVHLAVPAEAGQEIFHPSDVEQACGTVVLAAPHPTGGHDAIVSMQTSAAETPGLTLGSPEGPELSLLPLPYELLADV